MHSELCMLPFFLLPQSRHIANSIALERDLDASISVFKADSGDKTNQHEAPHPWAYETPNARGISKPSSFQWVGC